MAEVELVFGEQLDDEELLEYFWACLKEAEAVQADYVDTWTDLFKLYADGDGLRQDLRIKQRNEGHEVLALPYASGIIDTMIGSDTADRKEVRFRGQDGFPEDEIAAELYTRLVRAASIKEQCHIQDSRVQHNQLCTGYGFSETRLMTERRPMRPIRRWVPLWEMLWDPKALEPDLSDRAYDIRRRKWTAEKVQARWSKKKDDVADLVRDGKPPAPTVRGINRASGGGRSVFPAKDSQKRVEIHDFCYQRRVPRVVFRDPRQEAQEDVLEDEYLARLSEVEEENKSLQEAFLRESEEFLAGGDTDPVSLEPLPPPQEPELVALEELERYDAPCYYRAYVAAKLGAKDGGVVLEHKKQDVPAFPRTAVCGAPDEMPDEERLEYFGPLRRIADMQRVINKAWRLWIEIMERGVKGGGGLLEEDALPEGVTLEQFSKNASTPGMWAMLASGALSQNKYKELSAGFSPQGVVEFLTFVKDQLGEVSLVSKALQGTEGGDKANALVSNLQQQNRLALNPYLEPMAQYRMQTGMLMAQIFFHHVPTSDVDKILGDVIIPGVTHVEATDPTTGALQRDPKTLAPVMQPLFYKEPTGPDDPGIPMTAGRWLKGIDPGGLDMVSDTGQATPTMRQAVVQAFVQTDAIRSFLDAGMADVILPIFAKNLLAIVDPEDAKGVVEKLEKRFNEAEAMKTVEGMLQAFQGLPPDQQQGVAQQIFEQLQAMQQAQGGGEEAGQGGEPPVQ